MIQDVHEHWANIPLEMRQLDQWCVAGPDKAPLLCTAQGHTYNASPVKGPWMPFDIACQWAVHLGLNIGFVITKEDPFVCVDFDVKDAQSFEKDGTPTPRSKWTPYFMLERYSAIQKAFSSYTELSTGRKGMHIWLKGSVEAGIKRDGVEIYSSARFIVFTGIAVREAYYSIFNDIVIASYKNIEALPIIENDDLLDHLVYEIGGEADTMRKDPLVEIEPTEEDFVIWERASKADNRDKFIKLCNGDWSGYPSQSEADLALMSMFAFYTKSYSQIRRMFRQTKLGARRKAQRNDIYLNRTLVLLRSRIRREEEKLERIDIDRDRMARSLVKEIQEARVNEINSAALESVEVPIVGESTSLNWPPGMVGALAAFIYNSAPRPVKEVAIVAALGLMAGIVGKVFVIPQSGLNLYITLVGRSAIGKEAMHSGIALILDKLKNSIPGAVRFVDFSEFASGPALTKACAENQSFVNVSGEWGRKLKRLALEDGREGPMQSLRTAMTNLYQKSGPTSIVGGINYSNKEGNVKQVSGVAYSMIGETTPATFYQALTPSMMEDGFLSRFINVECTSQRPPENENPTLVLDDRLYNALCGLIVQCMTFLQGGKTQLVNIYGESEAILKQFDKEVDAEINMHPDDESFRQMWNRAHLKVKRVSAILAVCDNFINPVVTVEHVNWAMDLIRRDIELMARKIADGDVGSGDGVRERKLISIIKTYLSKPLPESYKIPEAMREAGVLPRKYLLTRTSTLSQFANHKLGATAALDLAVKSLVDSGYLMEVDKNKAGELYGAYMGRCFRVLNLS